jgi:uncharacterized protein YbjQ (UPF0145 family)
MEKLSKIIRVVGYDILEVQGHVFGVMVRSRNLFANIGAALKSVVGGELGALTANLEMSRAQAIDRMVGQAYAKGANAIVAFRFDASTAGTDASEVCAYGTAVRVRPHGLGSSAA